MKVLIYSNPNLLDCDLPLVRALQAKGVDVTYLIETSARGTNSTLLTIKKGHAYNGIESASVYPEMTFFSDYLNLDKVYFRNYYRKLRIPLIDALSLSIKVFKFLKDNQFDVSQRTQVFFFTDIILYYFRKKIVKMVHDPFPHSGSVLRGWTKFFYDFGMKIIPHFVVLNQTQYDKFCEFYKKNRQNVLLNQLGVYDCYNIFHKNEEVIKEGKNSVLFFGRISKYKGIEYLCEAMRIVRESVPDATITIVGGGNYYFDIEEYKALGYYNIINKYVSAQELSVYLAECTMVVCPYTDATQSGVVMTAYSHNKPVVASDVGGLSEQIDDRKSGLLVPPRDAQKIAEGIMEILQNAPLREGMKEYIKKEYYTGSRSWNTIADKYIEFYEQILDLRNE